MSFLKAAAIAVATVSLGTASLWSSGAAAQESAAEFNRQEWLRRSGGAEPRPARPTPPPAARPVVVHQFPPPPQASAPPRDFFSALFGPRYEPEVDRQRITITPDRRPGSAGSEEGEAKSYGGTGSYAFCVRTCDGRYFPLQGRPEPGGEGAALAQCTSFCPAAKMEVYYTYDSGDRKSVV